MAGAAGADLLVGRVILAAAAVARLHLLDAAELFVRALEQGTAGSRYHAVAEEGIALRDVAGVIGERLGVPVASATPAEIAARYGFLAPFLAVDNPVSSAATRARLGWNPTRRPLLDDLRDGAYFEAPAVR